MHGCSPLSSGGGFLLRARSPRRPRVLQTLLENWCEDNCREGSWEVGDTTQPSHTEIWIRLEDEDDAYLLKLSSEYRAMGNPPIQSL